MRREQLSRLAQLGVLVNAISLLVHMLQCERGASNVWLCSQGKLYAAECKASRALVNENLTALYDVLDNHSRSGQRRVRTYSRRAAQSG